MTALLPPNSTRLERLAAEALASIGDVPVPLRDLGDPDRCPVALLPYLAWARSVDRWDSSWSEATKRQVIKSAYFVHAHKGTIGALRRVVEPLGYLIRVREWWQENPTGTPGTFRLDIGVLDTGITESMYDALSLLIDDAKPVSRHLLGLAISLEARGPVGPRLAAYEGEILTVYAYQPEAIVVSGRALLGAGGTHSIDTLSIYP
ncbi:phage tail protein I [Pseudomonas sp. JBR1]|uniref:phage tail protein I n=1 Tax=Pseudomonas sp. JBR1 TaxID=3020907 RepID=UPI0023067B9D|nr:phage tail protein I [Pseudomonas sp. JBR1]WCE09483.1 phage tail protein I [Pseudomonas sp. JBR1]